MTRLDEFVDQLSIKYEKPGGKKISNTLFRSETWTTKKSSQKRINEAKANRKKLNLQGIKRLVYKDNERPTKVYYTRYADEFLIGISGGKNIAKSIMKEIVSFINSDLHLKTSNCELLHAKST